MAHIPKPFQRPSIDLGTSYDAYHRTWADWPISELRSGDIIADFGALSPDSVVQTDGIFFWLHAVNAVTGEKKAFKFIVGDVSFGDPTPTIWAFH